MSEKKKDTRGRKSSEAKVPTSTPNKVELERSVLSVREKNRVKRKSGSKIYEDKEARTAAGNGTSCVRRRKPRKSQPRNKKTTHPTIVNYFPTMMFHLEMLSAYFVQDVFI